MIPEKNVLEIMPAKFLIPMKFTQRMKPFICSQPERNELGLQIRMTKNVNKTLNN